MPRRLERALAFLAAATSIATLLADFYGVMPMRTAALALFLPGTALLVALVARGDAGFRSDVWAGTWSGFVAAIAYDLFRVPFVLSGMPLFKVFPRFGAMLTGGSADDALVQAIGWLYHFSNGITFGIMYVLLAGRRRWPLAIVWALGIEIAMLLTPYTTALDIPLTVKFVVVTVLAHAVFGLVLGLALRASREPDDDRQTAMPTR